MAHRELRVSLSFDRIALKGGVLGFCNLEIIYKILQKD